MNILLERRYFPFGTFGTLTVPGYAHMVTAECPWKGNQKGISCIPEGRYRLVRGRFNRGTGYDTYVIPDGDVDGDRTLIKIHVANRPSELKGCIAVGSKFGVVHGEWAVVASKPAHRAFMKAMETAEPEHVTLIIRQNRAPSTGSGTRPLLD